MKTCEYCKLEIKNRGIKYCSHNCQSKAQILDNPISKYHQTYLNGKVVRTHRKVWIEANGPIPEGYVIHHIDGNKLNNDISNLTIIPHGEHTRLHIGGEKSYLSKLTIEQVLEIRKLYDTGKYTYRSLAKMYNIVGTTIGTIVRRKTWKHI